MRSKSSNYYLPLNIDRGDILNSSVTISTDTAIQAYGKPWVESILTPNFYRRLTGVLDVTGAMVFNKVDNHKPEIAHTDIELVDGQILYKPYALNIVFDTSTDMQSKMCWYSTNTPLEKIGVKYSLAGTPYQSFLIGELNLEDEYCIDNMVTLVRTNVPHTIYSGNGCRTCISIRFVYPDREWNTGYSLFNSEFNQPNCLRSIGCV